MKLLLALMLIFSHGFYNTSSNSEVITIIENENNTSNTIWYKDKLRLNQNFSFSFEIYLGTRHSEGDGATLIISSNETEPTKLIGGIGGAIGSLNISDSLVLEFDTYFNGNSNNSVETDKDTGIKTHQSNGHVAIIETNDLSNKHKVIRHDAKEILADGSFRPVTVDWNASTKLMTFNVKGYEPLVHRVDIDKVFSSKTDVMFGYASANGVEKTRTQVKTNTYPHQAKLEYLDSSLEKESMSHRYKISKSISNDNGDYSSISFFSDDTVSDQVKVNGKIYILNNNILNLNDIKDDSLELEFSTIRGDRSEVVNRIIYQEDSMVNTYTWPNEVVPPVNPPLIPLEPPIKPPVSPPLTPLIPSVKPPIKPPLVEDSSDSSISNDLSPVEDISEIDNNILIDDANIDKSNNLKELIGKYVLIKKDVNSSDTILANSKGRGSVKFLSGVNGLLSGNKTTLVLNLSAFDSIPEVIAHDNYVFEGFYSSEGDLLDINNMSADSEYTARYRKENLKDVVAKQGNGVLYSLLISLLLILIRYLLNKDIERRKEKTHG